MFSLFIVMFLCYFYYCTTPSQAIEDLVMSIGPVADDRAHTTIVPNKNVDQFWLPLTAFDYGPGGKNGCGNV